MPEISRFLGIIIFMVYNDHQPPHFHARYGDFKITIEIETGIIEGKFPRRALNAVLEWYQLYRDQLLDNWKFSLEHKELKRIPPLE
jgi:hypothetical protein